MIISSLFADGCGALLIGASEVGRQLPTGAIVLRDMFSHLLDDADDGIVLGVNHNGITCELAPDLPRYIERGTGAVIDGVLRRNGLTPADIAMWAIHPGGPKIIESSVAALGLDPTLARTSWEVLAEHGNMLSVSLVFVLQRLLRQALDGTAAQPDGAGPPARTGIAFSFAPGVTVEGVLFDVIDR